MFYQPKYFQWFELVPKKIYDVFGDRSAMFLDNRMLKIIDDIRAYYNKPVLVNNWKWRGNLDERGYRIPETNTGAKLSQHKCGRAIDFNVYGMTADQVREDIKKYHKHGKEPFSLITTVEENVSWIHIDIRSINQKELYLVYP